MAPSHTMSLSSPVNINLISPYQILSSDGIVPGWWEGKLQGSGHAMLGAVPDRAPATLNFLVISFSLLAFFATIT